MRRELVIAGLALVLTGCAPSADVGAAHLAGPAVVHASNHVTGTYSTHCVAQGALPDPVCTPGSIRDDVDPAHLELTVCQPGWSDSILPPLTEFARHKTQAMLAYGVPATERPVTEYDHKVPRSLGGSNDVTNLWPEVSDEPGKGVHNRKDEVEDRIHRAVCAGRVALRDAQVAFATDWTTAAGLDTATRSGYHRR
jgi:hypothetical protein